MLWFLSSSCWLTCGLATLDCQSFFCFKRSWKRVKLHNLKLLIQNMNKHCVGQAKYIGGLCPVHEFPLCNLCPRVSFPESVHRHLQARVYSCHQEPGSHKWLKTPTGQPGRAIKDLNTLLSLLALRRCYSDQTEKNGRKITEDGAASPEMRLCLKRQ